MKITLLLRNYTYAAKAALDTLSAIENLHGEKAVELLLTFVWELIGDPGRQPMPIVQNAIQVGSMLSPGDDEFTFNLEIPGADDDTLVRWTGAKWEELREEEPA